MGIREIFATNLRFFRKKAELSQEELAYRADVDRTYVSSLERCVYAAGIDVVDRLAKELGVEAADLLRKPEGPVTSRKSKTTSIPKSRARQKTGQRP
jgi:transcriptional regulator with XRE-family HTH domain